MPKLPLQAIDDDGTWTYYITFGEGEPESGVILEDSLYLAAKDGTLARVEFTGFTPELKKELEALSRKYPEIEIHPESVSIKISDKEITEELTCQVTLDLDQNGKLYGIEII